MPAGGRCFRHFGRIPLPHAVVNPLFVGLLVSVLQSLCIHCQRLRLSPYYVNAVVATTGRTSGTNLLRRLKAITALCLRQAR